MKKMKKWGKLCALALTATLAVSSFSGCFYMISFLEEQFDRGNESFELSGDLTVEHRYDEEYGYYEVSVLGVLKNTTDKELDNVNVTVMLYDEDGNTLGSAYDYIDSVEANGGWRFCATATVKYVPVKAELYEVNAYNYLYY